VNGSPLSGSLVDFGLYFFHCARRQLDHGSGPYFYLAKLENHLEARLWNDVFCWAQDQVGIPRGTVRATVLIETISGSHAIGGMAAFVPDRRDEAATAVAFDKVRGDKERESKDGFDGSWVAHPDLIPICRAVFDQVLGQHPNQLDRTRDDVEVSAADLLAVETAVGDVTEAGLRANVRVSLGYLDAWLGGNGAVAIDHLMEDAATVEIARSQVWQWLHYGTPLADSRRVTRRLVDSIVDEELARWRQERPSTEHLDQAREIFTEVALGADYPSFSTIGAYTRFLVTATN
jgi:malate synthase